MFRKECKIVKSIKTIVFAAVVALSLIFNATAQNNEGFKNYKGEYIKQFKVGLGWGFVETDQKPLYILDGFGGWRGHWLPKTFHIEKRFDPSFRLNLGISHTRYAPRLQQDQRSNYFAADFNLLYNFRAFKHYATLKNTHTLKNLYKERYYLDGYFLAGLGYNTIAVPSFNTGIGADYWFHYSWGVNVQTTAKWTLDADNRFHMHHTIGVVYRLDQGNDAGALHAIRRNQNRKRKKKRVKKAIIPEKKEPAQEEDSFEDFTE